jgi:clan AA aspartic protease (TIGR02281 family)
MVRFATLFIIISIVLMSPCYGEMYKWVDEKGTVHFTDDLSKIPDKYRPDVETRKAPKEVSSPETKELPSSPYPLPGPRIPETQAFEVDLLRRHELLLAEVVLNGRVKQDFVVDTGASFTLINWNAARELGIIVDENTPFIKAASVSDVILIPLVTLNSLRVGNAEVENIEALIHNMPSYQGLLGNSFLNKFRVVIDSINAKMTLLSLHGTPSPDRPGGYSRDYWTGQFRFYYGNLEELQKLKAKYESQGSRSELNRVNNAIRYFENQLSELERRASFVGVPRQWRE